jgi:biopolymer transport protein ExbD
MAGFKLEAEEAEDESISTINVVPFVDIVLVLLIIFMLTSVTIVKASLMVDLPKAASAGDRVDSTVNIVFTKKEKLFVDGKPATLQQLGRIVRGQVGADPKLQAVISADRRSNYGKVIEIIDIVKLSGVKTFALNIERKAVQGPRP